MSTAPRDCILLFLKDPVPGQVKGRLAAALDEGTTVKLYRNFILDMLTTVTETKIECMLCVYPHTAPGKFKRWLGAGYHYVPQRGKDLGERMKNGFLTAFGMAYERAILLGSDIPDLPPSIIAEAFQALGAHDLTIGPAHDGGYYLIGFRKDTFIPELFDHMTWGGGTVLQETVRRVNMRGAALHRLPAWSDVDTLADVMALRRRNRGRGSRCPRTTSYLATIEGMFNGRGGNSPLHRR